MLRSCDPPDAPPLGSVLSCSLPAQERQVQAAQGIAVPPTLT